MEDLKRLLAFSARHVQNLLLEQLPSHLNLEIIFDGLGKCAQIHFTGFLHASLHGNIPFPRPIAQNAPLTWGSLCIDGSRSSTHAFPHRSLHACSSIHISSAAREPPPPATSARYQLTHACAPNRTPVHPVDQTAGQPTPPAAPSPRSACATACAPSAWTTTAHSSASS